jgi:hypothetical protein
MSSEAPQTAQTSQATQAETATPAPRPVPWLERLITSAQLNPTDIKMAINIARDIVVSGEDGKAWDAADSLLKDYFDGVRSQPITPYKGTYAVFSVPPGWTTRFSEGFGMIAEPPVTEEYIVGVGLVPIGSHSKRRRPQEAEQGETATQGTTDGRGAAATSDAAAEASDASAGSASHPAETTRTADPTGPETEPTSRRPE